MRTKFDTQLEILNNDLISLGAMCESAITLAINALLENDLDKAQQVMEWTKKSAKKIGKSKVFV